MPIARIAGELVYFAHVPRCAGSAVERYLEERFGPLAFLDRTHSAQDPGTGWTRSSPQHVDRAALSRLFPPGFLDHSFAVVRHPADRLRSVFLWQRDIEAKLPAGARFSEWIQALPLPEWALDNHTRPMVDLIPDDARIFRLEDGLDPLVAWLDVKAGDRSGLRQMPLRNGRHQRLAHDRRPARGGSAVLDPVTLRRIAHLYAADYERFGYDPADAPPEAASERTAGQPTCSAPRTVILHYHLFKNAGTSLDEVLKRNFGDRWVTREFPARGDNNTAEVADWIRRNPDAVAFSTHTALGPVPQIDGVRVISVLFLRDPIERISSAYRFERSQTADSWGAALAKAQDFEGYVRMRLAIPGDRQCRNFQTHRLASMIPGDEPELERARRALGSVSVLGLVERFDESIARLTRMLLPGFPEFTATSVRANISDRSAMNQDLPVEFRTLLHGANADDLALLQRARRHFQWHELA